MLPGLFLPQFHSWSTQPDKPIKIPGYGSQQVAQVGQVFFQ
jgi:hypothetical protein